MACQTFWELVWTNKQRGLSLGDAVRAALTHFDGCEICQADTNPAYDEIDSQHHAACPACETQGMGAE